jgi:hypothetical protein
MFAFARLVLFTVIGCTSSPGQKDRPMATAMPAVPLQVVTQQQLELTGQTNLGAALRELVPALH